MRTPGVSLEPLDGRHGIRSGHFGSVRLLVTCTNGHDVPVSLAVANAPPDWEVNVVPDSVDLDDTQRQVTASVAFAVPADAPPGPVELTLEATYPDGRCTITFPLDVVRPRRWAKVATLSGVAAGSLGGAGYALWRWLRR